MADDTTLIAHWNRDVRVTAPTPLDVTGCVDCPFLWQDAIGRFCARPGMPQETIDLHQLRMREVVSPEWCPLRTAPVLVMLRGGR